MARASHLAAPDAPLVQPDGTIIYPSGATTTGASAQSFRRIELASNTAAQRLVNNTTRKLAEMPALPKHMPAISMILVYTASGLSDNEIAVATNFPLHQVKGIRENPAYKQLEAFMFEAVRGQAEEEVQGILVNGAKSAANKVIGLLSSVDDKVALAASKDVLDRTGHKAVERIDLRAEMMTTFRIEVVDRTAKNELPLIDGELHVDDNDT